MEIQISKIKIKKRVRKEIGNLKPLMESLERNGLLNPIIINEKNELLSGYRRLMAAKRLGWNTIEVKVIKTSNDNLKKLEIELDENLLRKDFTPEEINEGLSLKKELLKLKNMSPFQRFFYKIFKKIIDFIKKLFKFNLL